MTNVSENNKRIAKNTIYLYIRMLTVMLVSLFTVRIALHSLGSENYGLYNVVGGIVVMFSFLTSTMISASQRFFAFNIGRNDKKALSHYFTMSFWCYIIFALLILVLAETVGLWFVVNKLTIPNERMTAAIYVYHFSILSFITGLVSTPYSSIIIAREKMNIYAVIGLLEAFMKLGIAYIIYVTPFDKLISYSALMSIMMVSTYGISIIYGLLHFEECKVKRIWDKTKLKEIMSYSGWSLFGALSGVLRSQGVNILLNIFFNPVVNAARAIAYQINTAINQFVLNFYKAVQPQITKFYAAKEQENFISLILRSSKYCYYLIFFLSLPILFETPYILQAWLVEVPDYTILFARLVIIIAIIDSISYPLQTAISATGQIKYFQIVTGGLLILNLPIALLFLYVGYPPQSTMFIAMILSIIAQLTRLYFARLYTGLQINMYTKKVIKPIVCVTFFSLPLPFVIYSLFHENIIRFLGVSIVSLVSTITAIMIVGISKRERDMILKLIKNRIKIYDS